MIGILRSLIQGEILTQGSCLQGQEFIPYALKLSRLQIVCLVIQQFGLHPRRISSIAHQETSSLFRFFITKLLGTESLCILLQVAGIEGIGIPCHVHKKVNGKLMGLDITDIEHPEFIHTMLISGLQLLPHLGDMRHGEPLAGSRRTIIAYMIIHTIAALVEIFLSIRKSAHMTEIVIAKHHDDIIGHLESLVIIIEHLAIERPYLRCLRGRPLGNITDNLTLLSNNLFHQPEVSLSTTCIGHRTVFVTSHTDGH